MVVKTKRTLPRCPVDSFQQLISGKYKLRIIWDLQSGPLRYGELQRSLLTGRSPAAPIAARVLSRELKALTEKDLIRRHDFQVIPPHVEYSLTPSGRSILPVIASMHDWGMKHLVRSAGARPAA
jgi:DNA-binding HxlR family transcriptional regulator